ncbi:MAG: type II CAAX endopeptidase family protein [Planctomycetota bacterium]|jgi:membrane protease YdiL (CAAX protease family)|nr:type II CAAX endopeptidase family protein [Planctomycetota bacterium]MDP6941540.1 type II CAAX endopeptidase family protein [Planctomycetota bacterium]
MSTAVLLALAKKLLFDGMGILFSLLLLSRKAGAPAPVMPFGKMKGYDLVVAGFIFLGVQAFFSSYLQAPSLILGLAYALVAGVLAWLWLGWREGSYLPRRKATPNCQIQSFGSAFACYAFALPGLLGVWDLNETLIHYITGEVPIQGLAAGFEGLGFLHFLGVAVFATLTQPLLEEGLFRGYLWRFLAGHSEWGPRRALLFSSLVFALAHEWQVFLPVFYLGLVFGWVYWRSGKLRYAFALHATHNALATSLIFYHP